MNSDLALEPTLPKCLSLHYFSNIIVFCLLTVSQCFYLGKSGMLSGDIGCVPTYPSEVIPERCDYISELFSLTFIGVQCALI